MEIKISSPSRRQGASVTAIGIKLMPDEDRTITQPIYASASQMLRRVAAMAQNDDILLDTIDKLQVIEDNNDDQLYLGILLDENAANAGAIANQLLAMNKFARTLKTMLDSKTQREFRKRVETSLNPQLPTTYLLTLLPFEYHTELISMSK